MAATLGRVCVTVTLLMCCFGGQAMDLLRAGATSGTDPYPIPTVHCRCVTYPKVTMCHWPEPFHSPPTHYIATYSERHNRSVTKECHLMPPGSLSPALNSSLPSSSSIPSEQLWQCQLLNLKLLTNYIINVTAVYSTGSSSYLASFMLEDIVKPDPPKNVQVSSHNKRDLLVMWSPPSSWTDLNVFPLKYHIMYQWKNRGTPKFANVGPLEDTRAELKRLTPGKTYLFQVCTMEFLGLGKCSSWSSPVNVTIPMTKP